MGNAKGLDASAHLFGHVVGATAVRHGQDAHEFLAAVAGDEVAGPAQAAGEHAADAAQAVVAGHMAVEVVEGLEVVDIEHDQRQFVPGAGMPGDFPGQGLVEVPPVGDAGQAVGPIEGGQFAVGGFQGGVAFFLGQKQQADAADEHDAVDRRLHDGVDRRPEPARDRLEAKGQQQEMGQEQQPEQQIADAEETAQKRRRDTRAQ